MSLTVKQIEQSGGRLGYRCHTRLYVTLHRPWYRKIVKYIKKMLGIKEKFTKVKTTTVKNRFGDVPRPYFTKVRN